MEKTTVLRGVGTLIRFQDTEQPIIFPIVISGLAEQPDFKWRVIEELRRAMDQCETGRQTNFFERCFASWGKWEPGKTKGGADQVVFVIENVRLNVQLN